MVVKIWRLWRFADIKTCASVTFGTWASVSFGCSIRALILFFVLRFYLFAELNYVDSSTCVILEEAFGLFSRDNVIKSFKRKWAPRTFIRKRFEGPRGFVIRIDLNVCCYVWLVFLCTCVEWSDKYLTKSANFAGRVPLFDNEASLTMFSAVHLGVEWYQMGN